MLVDTAEKVDFEQTPIVKVKIESEITLLLGNLIPDWLYSLMRTPFSSIEWLFGVQETKFQNLIASSEIARRKAIPVEDRTYFDIPLNKKKQKKDKVPPMQFHEFSSSKGG